VVRIEFVLKNASLGKGLDKPSVLRRSIVLLTTERPKVRLAPVGLKGNGLVIECMAEEVCSLRQSQEVEPLDQLWRFPLKRASILRHLGIDVGEIVFIGQTGCTAIPKAQELTAPVGLGNTCNTVAIFYDKKRKIARSCEVLAINPSGYDWIRPRTYVDVEAFASISSLPASAIRNLHEPVILMDPDGGDSDISLKWRTNEQVPLRGWVSFPLRLRYFAGARQDVENYRVIYVGQVKHAPRVFDQEELRIAFEGPDVAIFCAVQDNKPYFVASVMPLRGFREETILPLTYYNKTFLQLARQAHGLP
jgi:hypothetical protein